MNENYKKLFRNFVENIRYTWDKEHIIPALHPEGKEWRHTNAPVANTNAEFSDETKLILKRGVRDLDRYLTSDKTWFKQYAKNKPGKLYQTLTDHPIAYLSLEFGVVDWLHIYSGGLGVLAGDFLKESSDMGVPMVGIGLFYHHGYFEQRLDESGWQHEEYPLQLPEEYPMELVMNQAGDPVETTVEIIDHEVWVRAWRLKVGRTNLLLLDTDYEKNEIEEDRMITAHLYGGDEDTRLRQEIVLGMGGARILRAAGINPSVYHMNEGHSGFLVLELARHYIQEHDMDFEAAVELVDDHLIFTNHTLKQAGNDIYPRELMDKFFQTYTDDLKTDLDQIFKLGQDDKYANGKFSMTMLGLRNAKFSNGVSQLHGEAAKDIWPNYSLIPITNGVHMPTWVSKEMHELYDEYLDESWHDPQQDLDLSLIDSIPEEELWHAHQHRKHTLARALKQNLGLNMDPDVLTIVWARRFASYKRPGLILSDLERLERIVNKAGAKVQIIVGGKAHPRDQIGKKLLQEVFQTFNQPRFNGNLIFTPEYNWLLAHYLVSAADVWLNTPYRLEEACGTSGMKAAANGALQFTTLDGWTDEVDWVEGGIGWAIDNENAADSIYTQLENEIVPMYYAKEHSGFSSEWVKRMKKSIKVVLKQYSTTRMMSEYLDKLYAPLVAESGIFDSQHS